MWAAVVAVAMALGPAGACAQLTPVHLDGLTVEANQTRSWDGAHLLVAGDVVVAGTLLLTGCTLEVVGQYDAQYM